MPIKFEPLWGRLPACGGLSTRLASGKRDPRNQTDLRRQLSPAAVCDSASSFPPRPTSPAIHSSNAALAARARSTLRRLPPLSGAPILLESSRGLRDRRGPIHAGSFLRQRRIVFDCARAEFPRIFVHELFHFVWLRLGNRVRRSYEEMLKPGGALEPAPGELGWSAEWRKRALTSADIRTRSRRWREYCCESFCDAAAWLYSGVARHGEFTLPAPFRARRRSWFAALVRRGTLSI